MMAAQGLAFGSSAVTFTFSATILFASCSYWSGA